MSSQKQMQAHPKEKHASHDRKSKGGDQGLHKKKENCEKTVVNGTRGAINATMRIANRKGEDPKAAANQELAALQLFVKMTSEEAIESYETNGLRPKKTKNEHKKKDSHPHSLHTPRAIELM